MLAFSPGQNRFPLRSLQLAHFAIDIFLQSLSSEKNGIRLFETKHRQTKNLQIFIVTPYPSLVNDARHEATIQSEGSRIEFTQDRDYLLS